MPLYQVIQRAAGPSSVIPLDLRRYAQGVGILVTITGTLTCSVQLTGDNIQQEHYLPANGHWNNHETLIGLTSSQNGNLLFPVSALRLNVTAYTNGEAVMSVIQGEG